MNTTTLLHRPRRLRASSTLRDMVRETRLSLDQVILPLFVHHDPKRNHPISTMPGYSQFGMEHLPQEIERIQSLGIRSVILFGIPKTKDALGSSAYDDDGIVQQAIPLIKQAAPELFVIADVCCCEYTDHGHCGVVQDKTGHPYVDNDATLPLLVKQSVSLARSGADMVAPSGMMDGMVAAIRAGLDKAGFTRTPIMSYAVKYASALYGPFREAAEGAPQWGDRRGYQMNPANARVALREAALDAAEGADILMVKPAQFYLDVIYRVKQHIPELPLAAYQVSGEYAMIKAAASMGCLDEKRGVMESLLAIKRAGADMIITYFAKELAAWL